MDSQSENAYWPKKGAPIPRTQQPEKEHSKTNKVLERMRNLIVEIQSFKVDNEKQKKTKERKEINEISLQII